MTKQLAKTRLNRSSRFMASKLEQTPFCASCRARRSGFTLIELLVVVLIIGILASVALPQYQVAVWKSRYARAKIAAEAITQAQHLYFLENGHNAVSLDDLTFEFPAQTHCYIVGNSTDWGCSVVNERGEDVMTHYFASGQRYCIVWDARASAVQHTVCKQETGKAQGYTFAGGGYTQYGY